MDNFFYEFVNLHNFWGDASKTTCNMKKTPHKILVATDKFKGSLTSVQAAEAIQRGIRRAFPDSDLSFDIVGIADGGDGSASVLQSVMGNDKVVEIKTVAVNPLGVEAETSYLSYSEPDGFGNNVECAFIEMAKVSGLELLLPEQRNPWYTTTFGLGQLLREACLKGARKITLSIGGSATNDCGTGMLQALGFRFYNKDNEVIEKYMCGGLLKSVSRIEAPEGKDSLGFAIDDCEIKVICDVTNPLLGENGATMVYGPQKGADAVMLANLESGMANIADIANTAEISYRHLESGAGAAGGVGYAVIRFLKGEMISGWRFFADITGLEQKIAGADLVITGEGSLDSQSLSGKVVSGVLSLARQHNRQAVIFCGVSKLPLQELGGIPCYSIASLGYPLEICMSKAAQLLEELAYVKIRCTIYP